MSTETFGLLYFEFLCMPEVQTLSLSLYNAITTCCSDIDMVDISVNWFRALHCLVDNFFVNHRANRSNHPLVPGRVFIGTTKGH